MHLSAVVLAAGAGLRFGSRIPKPLVKINSRPIIIHCLEVLSSHPEVTDIIVVVNVKNEKRLIGAISKYCIRKITRIVKGGARRQDSVFNALKTIGANTDLVLIHDGVRPFIDRRLVSSLINTAKIKGAAVAAVPVKATIKKANAKLTVEKTVDRENLWEIQTPQVFKRDLIVKAYKRFGNLNVTDDSMLVEKLGVRVSIVPSSYKNIKITTPEDLVIARSYLKRTC
jgi:2-C-methyl-D-erythritol 4-phosphate cytidylyltransferase